MDQAAQGAQNAGQQAQNAGQQTADQSKDYGDKAFEFIAKKSGRQVDGSTAEAITDGLRGAFEKFSGKKVDPKYSN